MKLNLQLFATEITDYTITETNAVLKSCEANSGDLDNVFVLNLSQKEVNITYTSTDTIYEYLFVNLGRLGNNTFRNATLPISVSQSFYLGSTNFYYVGIRYNGGTIYYSKKHGMNPSTNYDDRIEQLDAYTRISYLPPTILNLSIKRPTATSNSVDITCSGSYFNGTIGTENHGGTYKPTLILKYWRSDQTESQATSVTISSSYITASDGNYTLSYSLSGIDYRYAYRFKLEIRDKLIGKTTYFSNTISTEIVVAAGIPVWSEFADRVDFAKLSINHQLILAPYVLYTNSGNNGSVTLTDTTDSFANYEYVEIFYRTNDDDYKSIKIDEPNGKYVLLDASATSGNYIYIKSAHYSISGNKMTLRTNLYSQARIGNNVATTWNKESNRIYVTKIIGYK